MFSASFAGGKDYLQVAGEFFEGCDSNRDLRLTAQEFENCLEHHDALRAFSLNARTQPAVTDIIRALCIDAMIQIADVDSDWKLDIAEFQLCVDPDYVPPNRS